MTSMIASSILSTGIGVALIMIGLRNWGGWLVFAIDNVAWMVYSAVNRESVVVHIFNILLLAITVYFAYRWGKTATSEAESRSRRGRRLRDSFDDRMKRRWQRPRWAAGSVICGWVPTHGILPLPAMSVVTRRRPPG